MAVIVAGIAIEEKMSGIGNYKCRRPNLVIDAGHANYRGYFSMEFDSPGDPYAATKKLIKQSLSYLS